MQRAGYSGTFTRLVIFLKTNKINDAWCTSQHEATRVGTCVGRHRRVADVKLPSSLLRIHQVNAWLVRRMLVSMLLGQCVSLTYANSIRVRVGGINRPSSKSPTSEGRGSRPFPVDVPRETKAETSAPLPATVASRRVCRSVGGEVNGRAGAPVWPPVGCNSVGCTWGGATVP